MPRIILLNRAESRNLLGRSAGYLVVASNRGSEDVAMGELLTIANVTTLAMLIILQAVLGFDNLLYISIESKRVTPAKQSYVRRMGIGLAIGLRILLLFTVVGAIQRFEEPFLTLSTRYFEGAFNVESVVELVGGGFIIYTAMKEIAHMLAVHELEMTASAGERSAGAAVAWIVLMNLVFSFDSIISAMALTDNFIVMATAIIVSGLLMIWLADHVAEFLQKNRMYEVLGLFILFVVGIMLVSEGGHNAHLKFFGYEIEAMRKSTFYFVLAVLILADIVQSRYQKKLAALREKAQRTGLA